MLAIRSHQGHSEGTVRTLLVLRHAKAVREESGSDKERELVPQGRTAARKMGELVRTRGLAPELVICSTATRARETFELFSEGAGYSGRVEFLDDLYLAPAVLYVEAVQNLGGGAQKVMVIGHNPGLEALVDVLTGSAEPLAPAALAVCELPVERWEDLDGKVQGTLKELFRPKEMD
jgi:phosphohistidine phosphatase